MNSERCEKPSVAPARQLRLLSPAAFLLQHDGREVSRSVSVRLKDPTLAGRDAAECILTGYCGKRLYKNAKLGELLERFVGRRDGPDCWSRLTQAQRVPFGAFARTKKDRLIFWPVLPSDVKLYKDDGQPLAIDHLTLEFPSGKIHSTSIDRDGVPHFGGRMPVIPMKARKEPKHAPEQIQQWKGLDFCASALAIRLWGTGRH